MHKGFRPDTFFAGSVWRRFYGCRRCRTRGILCRESCCGLFRGRSLNSPSNSGSWRCRSWRSCCRASSCPGVEIYCKKGRPVVRVAHHDEFRVEMVEPRFVPSDQGLERLSFRDWRVHEVLQRLELQTHKFE